MMKPFTFIDLFSGIGAFHQAAVKCGGKCIMACDINQEAREIYMDNYGIMPDIDVRKLKPVHADLLMAGCPCQSFSTIGERAGTKDPRGTLIYTVARYIAKTKPKAFIIENVKGLTMVDAFDRFMRMVEKAGYTVSWAILDAADFGVPQHRERVYIVGQLARPVFNFEPLQRTTSRVPFRTIMEAFPRNSPELTALINHKFDDTPLIPLNQITPTAAGFLLRAKKNNYINNKLFSSNGTVGTLCATFSPIIYDETHHVTRQMSKKEMLRCQGFPATFRIPGGRTKTMYFTGNAVCVNVITEIIKNMIV